MSEQHPGKVHVRRRPDGDFQVTHVSANGQVDYSKEEGLTHHAYALEVANDIASKLYPGAEVVDETGSTGTEA